MKILVAGNSQTGCLKEAYDADPSLLPPDAELFFYVTPGAQGPYLAVENDKLVLTLVNEEFPPRIFPNNTSEIPVGDFDLIVVSALGYIDGGFRWENPILSLAILSEFAPTMYHKAPVSDMCYREMVLESFRNHYGFQFIKSLRENYIGRVVVQPFPYTSDEILSRDDWHFAQKYRTTKAAHQFFAQAKNAALETLCDEFTLDLLGYPRAEWSENYFTPANLMRSSDCIHPTAEYGALVLRQISDSLAETINKG